MRNRMFLVIALLLFAVLTLAACGDDDSKNDEPAATTAPAAEAASQNTAANAAPATYTTLTVEAAHDQASADPQAIVVDVREPSEWQTTGVPEGATLISLNTITNTRSGDVTGLPADKPIYVICNSGNRSRVAAEHLISLGYSTVYNIDGGIQAWLSANLPTEPYAP